MLQIRNPWAAGEWTGNWSDKSKLWQEHPGVAAACAYNPDAHNDDGMFWMEYEDFCKHFEWIGICDRSVGMDELVLEILDEKSCTGPCRGCVMGCCDFWALSHGFGYIYFPMESSNKTRLHSTKRWLEKDGGYSRPVAAETDDVTSRNIWGLEKEESPAKEDEDWN